MLNKNLYIIGFLIFIAAYAHAKPKTTVITNYSLANFAQIKVTNETGEKLACYVAIDGYKIRFQLQPRRTSRWFKATDKRFKPTSLSHWCDYLELYPDYKKYKAY